MTREEAELEGQERGAARREAEARIRAGYVCDQCGSLDGMVDYYWWNIIDLACGAGDVPTLYCHPDAPGDMVFAPCYQCNRLKRVPAGYRPLSWAGVLEWAHMAQESDEVWGALWAE